MTLIRAVGLTVDLPVFSVKARSLRRRLMSISAGGRLMQDGARRVVVRALEDVSFEIGEGERVGLVGHNGSGKSTLLRVLAGIYRPSAGQLTLSGRTSAALDVWTGLDSEATGEENIVGLALHRGHTRAVAREAAPSIAEFTELGAFLAMPVKTYSAGMTARLAFAAATSFSPDILLMDEWITAVDADFLRKAQVRLERQFSEARAVVIATHDTEIIRRFCTRVIRLEGGRIVEDSAISRARSAA